MIGIEPELGFGLGSGLRGLGLGGGGGLEGLGGLHGLVCLVGFVTGTRGFGSGLGFGGFWWRWFVVTWWIGWFCDWDKWRFLSVSYVCITWF